MNLSKDVWGQIFTYLKPYEILQASGTCKVMYRASWSNAIQKIVKGRLKDKFHLAIHHWIAVEKFFEAMEKAKIQHIKLATSISDFEEFLTNLEYVRRHVPPRVSNFSQGLDKIIVGLQCAFDLKKGGKIYIAVDPKYINSYDGIITKKFDINYCMAYHKNKQYSKAKFYILDSLSPYEVVLFTKNTFVNLNKYNPLQPNDIVIIDIPDCTSLGSFCVRPLGSKTCTEIILS